MIQQKGWIWILLLGLTYLGFAALAYTFVDHIYDARAMYEGVGFDADFEGNDWVTWVDSKEAKGVIAEQVHPLPRSKPLDRERVQRGDRIRRIGYEDVRSANEVNTRASSARPGYLMVVELERTDPVSYSLEKINAFLPHGFRLTFSFNEVVAYWHVIGWLVGIFGFVALVMLAILVPVLRTQRRGSRLLIGVVVAAMSLFLLQLFRHLYLIIESDLQSVGSERIFILGYVLLVVAYAVLYFVLRTGVRPWWVALPNALTGLIMLYFLVDILYLSRDMRYFHDLIEQSTALFFLLNLGSSASLFFADRAQARTQRDSYFLIGMGVAALLGIIYYSLPVDYAPFHREHAFFFLTLLLFLPLVNATFLQLQFGKVSLVVTQTIQYLVAIIVSVLLYLLIVQLFDYINTGIQYRRILEFITFILVAIVLRLLYKANQSRLRRYFVTTQQEKVSRFRGFIARIPQYTNADLLRRDIVKEVEAFFQAQPVVLWWSADPSGPRLEGDRNDRLFALYQALEQANANWSKSKELSSMKLEDELEGFLIEEGWSLVSPVTVDEDTFALLMLGRKKRGVYNLADLEMISQLIQQTQLTLNVLQLVQREKELIQQTYEANLTALRSQINPHFLFNTLNSIGELVHESAELAEAAVEKLAFIFRYTLKKSSQNFVPLQEEMSLITTYLDLEKIRFGERLRTQIDISPEVKEVLIPAFILQTLVENCIKHGIAKILDKGLVSIEARKENGWLVCDVYDNGPGIDVSRIFQSTGLSNSISRLENLYDQKDLLQFENTGDGTLVRMKIPLDGQPAPVSAE